MKRAKSIVNHFMAKNRDALGRLFHFASFFSSYFTSRFPGFPNGRNDGYEKDSQDDELKIVLYKRNVPEEIACQRKKHNPDDTTDNVVQREIAIRHAADPCYKRRKGADDWHKARQENGFASMLLKESMGTIKLFFLHPFDIVSTVTKTIANPVIDRIANSRCDHQQNQ